MSDNLTRRNLLIAFGATGVLTPVLAQHVHQAVTEIKSLDPGGKFQPKCLTAHEYQTLRKLAEVIVPGATDAGAAEFIDFLSSRNDKMAQIYTGGLAWMDDAAHRRYQSDWLSAQPAQQTALLDLIAYRKNETPELLPGIRFFAWCRNMVLDAYYTSPVGIKDIGFMGNQVLSSFSVPEEALQYALKRSPFANS
ncbi:MAG: gluconate 2-dehydrogenase subunit 3 family protein [Acidobacteriota bacterium]|nr:gluconate 2-dehydrogenase subunit 3 family protein [Acidobacteriota bacterium]